MANIAEMYITGRISDARINQWMEDAICNWDGGDGSLQMHEYLGLTLEQYKEWSDNPDSIRKLKEKSGTLK